MLKKKLQEWDRIISGKYVQVRNSVEGYLKAQGGKKID